MFYYMLNSNWFYLLLIRLINNKTINKSRKEKKSEIKQRISK